jgi:hypothetical protein
MASFDAIDLLLRYETPLVKDMDPDDDVLEWVAAFVGSETFQDAINDFCGANAGHFSILLTKGGPSAADLDQVEPSVASPSIMLGLLHCRLTSLDVWQHVEGAARGLHRHGQRQH